MDMSLPSAVAKAAKKSSDLSKLLQEGKAPKPEDGTTVEKTTPPKEPDTLPPGEKNQEDTPPVDPYKDRYLTLKGKYDAEIPRLNQTIKALHDSETILRNEIESLKATLSETKKEPVPSTESIDFDDLSKYGEEFGKLGGVIENLKSQLSSTQKELSDAKAQLKNVSEVQQTTGEQAREQYMSTVKKGIRDLGGDFDSLNTDQGFLNYLRQFPPGEQQSRFTMLNQCERSMNVEGTLGFFKEYLSSLKKPEPQSKPTPPNLQPDTKPPGPNDINPVQPKSTKTWTRRDISKFYVDKASGRYNGREDEAKKIEADIFRAPQEGRVTA